MPRRKIASRIAVLIGWCLAGGATSMHFASAQDEGGPTLVQRSDEAVEQAFQGEEFWWKRTSPVDDPDLPWLPAILQWIGDGVGRILGAIGRFISTLLESLLGGFGAGEARDFRIVAWLVAALGVAFLLWRSRHLWQIWLSRDRTPQPIGPTANQQSLPEAAALLDQARNAFGSGKYRDAVRFSFLALLAALQQRHLLRYDPSRTNREYYHDLVGNPEVAQLFLEAARPFERAWYGQRDVDRAEAEEVLAVCRGAVEREGGLT